MIVSITDQLMIVRPTLIPKYSLTSQKPASLTWEKNSEPAPTARASRAVVGRSRSAASGATMPAAVRGGAVKTRAQRRHDAGRGDGGDGRRTGGQPDADGDQPAQDQRGEVRAVGPVGDQPTDAGVDQQLLEPAARGDDEQDAGDRGQRPAGHRRDPLTAEANRGAQREHGDDQPDEQ